MKPWSAKLPPLSGRALTGIGAGALVGSFYIGTGDIAISTKMGALFGMDMWWTFFVLGLAGTPSCRVVFAQLSLFAQQEQLLERLVLDPSHSPGRDMEPALLVLLDQSPFDEHLDHLGVLFFPILEVGQQVLSVFEQVLADLVEEPVG